MKTLTRTLMALAACGFSAHTMAQATFYEHEGFGGRTLRATESLADFQRYGFNDRASSVEIIGMPWEVCRRADYGGGCVVLREGRYPSLAALDLNDGIESARILGRRSDAEARRPAPLPEPAPGPAQARFFERESFSGRSFTTTERVRDLRRTGFERQAWSAVVLGERWEVCEEPRLRGNCTVLRPGRYDSLAAMGLREAVASARAVPRDARIADNRYAPEPAPVYDSRRRGRERLYEANITSSRAVLATSGQRCWVESQPVAQERGRANVGAAIAGALLGGILGHQVGGGSGRDIATVGGAVAGAAVGSQVGRGDGPAASSQDVQRCENVPGGARPAYWDVGYNFRGQEHRVQMAEAPGPTITVNEQGQPRE